jgi:2-polyprenyl-3-methyl-5-hydroxy-6-metoxy-1,4-benzoquinol methylase
MEDVLMAVTFIGRVLKEIKRKDPFHFKQLGIGMRPILGDDFNQLHAVICNYFEQQKITPEQVATDYLHMIMDMRHEMKYFVVYDKYSCKSQTEALEKFYGKPKVMDYYLNALLVSNLLWQHHFRMLMFFKRGLSILMKHDEGWVLDIGSGHGLYSYYVSEAFPEDFIDVVDISKASLKMAKAMMPPVDVAFYNKDIYDFKVDGKYDLVILGEVLEHLDDPLKMLNYIKELLSSTGMLWVTVPTNAPTIDHVYLFRSEQEILKMIDDAGFNILESLTLNADRLTQLVGAFCTMK